MIEEIKGYANLFKQYNIDIESLTSEMKLLIQSSVEAYENKAYGTAKESIQDALSEITLNFMSIAQNAIAETEKFEFQDSRAKSLFDEAVNKYNEAKKNLSTMEYMPAIKGAFTALDLLSKAQEQEYLYARNIAEQKIQETIGLQQKLPWILQSEEAKNLLMDAQKSLNDAKEAYTYGDYKVSMNKSKDAIIFSEKAYSSTINHLILISVATILCVIGAATAFILLRRRRRSKAIILEYSRLKKL
ncbi:MAG: hypothetical protein QW589_01425 [Candidatus Bathyarchaeia archaeon]